MRELSFIRLPLQIYLQDTRTCRSFIAPADDLFYLLLLALEDGFDASVGQISDPAADPEPNCLVTCIRTEVDALNKTVDDYMSTKIVFFAGLHALHPDCVLDDYGLAPRPPIAGAPSASSGT